MDSSRMRILMEYIEKSVYNIHGIRIRKLNIPQLRRLLGDGVNETTIRRVIEEMERFRILAYGGDGSKSSWIILVDMENEEDLRSLREMCTNMRRLSRLVEEFLRDPAGWVRGLGKLDSESRLVKEELTRLIIDVIAPCLAEEKGDIKPCIARANFMILLDDNIVASLANMKVRVVNDPCELVSS